MPSAARVSWARFRVACLTGASLVILSVVIYLLLGGTIAEKKTKLYCYLPDASGLLRNAPVRLDGITIGKITNVGLSGLSTPNRVVKAEFEVGLTFLPRIPSDSTAQVSADNLLGDQFLDINAGNSAEPIRPGAEVTYKAEPELLKNIDMQQFEARIASVDAMLRDIEEGRGRVGQFFVGEDIYDDLLRRIAELERGLRAATRTTESLGKWLYSDRAYQQIREPIERIDQMLRTIESGQGTAGRLVRDQAQYAKLVDTIGRIRQDIASLDNSGAGKAWLASDELYLRWMKLLAGWIRSIDDLNAGQGTLGNLLVEARGYESITGSLRDLETTIRDFRTNPQKYLRIVF